MADDEQRRDELLARVADVLRRSAVDDAEELVRWVEQNLVETPQAPVALRLDGIYVGETPDAVSQGMRFLRFFEGNRVLAVTSTGNAEQVRRWLHPGSGHPEGLYFLAGRNLDFRTTSADGRIDYAGRMLAGGRIHVRWRSFINRATGDATYAFHPYT